MTAEVDFEALRRAMVRGQILARGVRHPAVLKAMEETPRERFVPPGLVHQAFSDRALSIGEGQTISQPYMVAWMIEALDPDPQGRVLEIGTGSGYAAAVLSRVFAEVYTVERLEPLYEEAKARLEALGCGNVFLRLGDGSLGWPQHAPYDAIVVAAQGPNIPMSLERQLKPGGRLVMPVQDGFLHQDLVRVVKTLSGSLSVTVLGPVQFVPLIGQEGHRE